MLAAVVYGLVDAFHRCLLFTLFFLVLMIFELAKRRANVPKYVAFFIAASYVSLLLFSMGVFMQFLYAKQFFAAGRIFYIFAGALLAVCGAVHLRDWWGLTRRGKQYSIIAPLGTGPYEQGTFDIKILIIAIMAAVILAAFSTIWPVNQYILIYSNYLLVPGKTLEIFLMLLVYNFMLVTPLLGVFLLLESDFFARWAHQAQSMAKVVLSALLVASGSGLIYIFRQY